MKPATPQQYTGVQSNTRHSITTSTDEQAEQLFNKARKNLFNVNNWEELSGSMSATFRLIDKAGNKVVRTPRIGDYFKIDIPAPDNKSGRGHDWVQIEKIEDNLQNPQQSHTAITVRPTNAPDGEENACHHFFTNEATSTFSVERNKTTITAAVYGRNEKPNTDTPRLFDKIRNAVIGFLAMLGFNKPQWSSLVKGILEKDTDAITFQK